VSTSKKGSKELVGEFFEVRSQVDRDLTTVSRVDRQLGLIKNLGRHNLGDVDLLEVWTSLLILHTLIVATALLHA
jgi:hypothetical protein